MCVDIDLTSPLVAQFWLDERWHSVEYEGLHTICFCCGRYGHREETCLELTPTTTARIENGGVGTVQTQPNKNNTLPPSVQVGNARGMSKPTDVEEAGNSFGYCPQMIAQTSKPRPCGNPPLKALGNERMYSQSNKYEHLMHEDPRNIDESL